MVEEQAPLSPEALASVDLAALLNAVRHGGRADAGAVVSRVLAERPDLRRYPSSVAKAARSAVERVNAMTREAQEGLVKERMPGGVVASVKEEREGLPPLRNAVKGKTAFRFPPEPSGYMTVGNAMACTINSVYAEEYQGELWLRFEDTNPKKVAKRYYESFRRGIQWLGIRWDHEKNVSDDMDLIYDYGRRLIDEGKAYACTCTPDVVKALRQEGRACEHRGSTAESGLAAWGEMLANRVAEGEVVIRFKGDMGSVNYSLRDPNLFRTIRKAHPLTGEKYTVWPTYHLANTVEDELCGITHILRSSEFNVEVQSRIRDALGFRQPEVIQFSRFNFRGTPVGKRLLRPLVEEGLVTGWDDPRMPTVDGLRRRGVLPEAIRAFTIHVGYTKAEHEYDWSMLLSINRKLLDPRCRRVFFVPDPVEIRVEGAPSRRVSLPFHPELDLGRREVATGSSFLVPKADVEAVGKGGSLRLMDLYNVEIRSPGPNPVAAYAGDELVRDIRKVQWVVPPGVGVTVLEPGLLFNDDGKFNTQSLSRAEGLAEEAFRTLEVGESVQFPRFGFCRVDQERTCVLTSR